MRRIRLLAVLSAVVSLLAGSAEASLLFTDTFDRPDNTDIDADATGMGGSVAPMVYQEAFEGSGQPTSIQVLSGQLNVARGAGMSSLYLDHNFTDAQILADGGFSVSLDVVSINTADDTANRFGGFGVGNTRAEAQAAADSFDSPAPFRGVVGQPPKGVSDFYVDLALDQNLRVWSNGVILNTLNVGAPAGTIRADFLTADFNAGSPVTALVYFNGIHQDTQSFSWDQADANYIGISGRTAANGVMLDNLAIATIPEPASPMLLVLGGWILWRRRPGR